MITLLGTGHVFRIAEPVSFIVKNIWPDAVLIELDESRYNAISSTDEKRWSGHDRAYRNMAKYQKSMAEEYGSQVGAEFVAAAEMGRTIGAVIEFIDKDANQTMKEVWDEMPFFERMRFNLSMIGDRFRRKKKADAAVEEFAENEKEYLADMRRKYPTLVRKLIDERNVHMAEKIAVAAEKYENIIVVIGDGHVEGIALLLAGEDIRKIRLRTLMDMEMMNSLRAELWTGMKEGDE
ncbi:MAG: TraB domain-containing protein [Methanomassiliicoccaceae archaeon]|nr:TraB domain-containing protein [Methanomassiliicoccaceae archaeon]